MRPLAVLLAVLAVLLAAFWLLPSRIPEEDVVRRTDLPWQVTALPDGTSQVLGLHLGSATLDDAVAKLGTPENIALFVDKTGGRSLEVYFGTVLLGPLKGTIIATLAADPDLLDALEAGAVGREGAQDGAIKRYLGDKDKTGLGGQRLVGISYVPGYSGLDADFFRERLGEPPAWRTENEHAVSWFYPAKGLSLLIDTEGKDVFEFTAPRDFVLPTGATGAAH
jgi:hypothetical protein